MLVDITFCSVYISYYMTFQAMMNYKSWLYRTLETIVFFVPSLIFSTPVQKQLVTVELCDSYFSDPVGAVINCIKQTAAFFFI